MPTTQVAIGCVVECSIDEMNRPRGDVVRVVLGCEIGDLLIPGPEKVHRPGRTVETERAAVGAGTAAPKVIPKRRDGRSLPPE
jgi:hypothetical protein